ncbi:MAG TPA: hypothetical protein VMI73_04625 [Trebonia sp.]|nr:hypothetical protein [Trebonia sp.]
MPGDPWCSGISRGRSAEAVRSSEVALTSGIDPGDLETTMRVLAEVAERAHALRGQ